MITRMKLRPDFFRGAGTYKLNDKDIVVDEFGFFDLDGIQPPGFYAFATVVRDENRPRETWLASC